ncbi:MAG: hypothetical protein ACTSQF_06655 [Candidatus Heimdallarchaeaceae archaeon]
MSSKIRILDKQSMWPSVVAVFAISFLAQIPHFYYLHDIVGFNTWEYLPLLIAFPIFGTFVLTAVSLLITESLMNRVRDVKERKLFRYLLRGALFTVLLYFVIQILIVFFGFQVLPTFSELMPPDLIDNIAFKEIFGMSLMLIVGVFINPPFKITRRRTKKK